MEKGQTQKSPNNLEFHVLLSNFKQEVEDRKHLFQQRGETLREREKKLKQTIGLGKEIESCIVDRLMTLGEEGNKFIEDKILLPLRQRIIDLQHELLILQQELIIICMLKRSNTEVLGEILRALSLV
ncbi:MAG: hypothetical protein Q8R40_03355 [bacterium]|nr:hypothetical protein [bacterium]